MVRLASATMIAAAGVAPMVDGPVAAGPDADAGDGTGTGGPGGRTGRGGVIDLGDDHVLPHGSAGTERTFGDRGFARLSSQAVGAQYTVRLITSPGVENYRPRA